MPLIVAEHGTFAFKFQGFYRKKDEAMRDFIVPLTRSQGRAARPYGINPGKRHGNARRPQAAG